jgi:formylglycine-generating enzyme required for sulfatase activity
MKSLGKQMAVAVCGLLLSLETACANGLQVTNVWVDKRDDTTAYIKFDISWQHAWRYTNINHDAAWVFFKVRPEGSTTWQHATLEGSGVNPPGYSNGVGTAADLIVPNDRVGLFVRRAEQGSGTLAVTNVQAVWNIASNGLVKTSRVYIWAQAMEMVYVAEGSFAAGSGGNENNAFTLTTINTNDASVAPSGSGSLGGAAGGYPTGQTAPNALWPNGYSAFYCMKYEVSEGQWVDFFNMLTDAQKSARAAYASKMSYNSGVASSAARDRACNNLCWPDCAALADWSGLRPMTELEFEKACRGPLPPVANEYVWGTTTISATTAIISENTGLDTATGGNCNYDACSPDRPYRVGIYATASSSRSAAGASYWGILDLGGSLWEQIVSIGSGSGTAGRAFTGAHGDGILTASGDANVTAWPGWGGDGSGFKGGAFIYSADWTRTSDRLGAIVVYPYRCQDYGCRAVRTAPAGVLP